MDCGTGHLVSAEEYEQLKKLLAREDIEKYEPVPEHLNDAATLELAGRREALVGENASGSMSEYMRGKREEKRRKKALRRIPGCKV